MLPDFTYNFTGHKIGDTVAAAFLIQSQIRKWTEELEQPGPTLRLIDAGAIRLREWFPDLAPLCVDAAEPDWSEVPGLPLGNLWITAPSVKAVTGWVPDMKVANDDEGYDVALHCLTDAEYNGARNHTTTQFDELERWLNWHKLRVFRVPPMHAKATVECGYCYGTGRIGDGNPPCLACPQCRGTGSEPAPPDVQVDWIISQIGRAKCFIGGDSGFSHCYAAMHPDRPLIAIYGDAWHDVVAFEPERQQRGQIHHWCSLPLSHCVYHRTMVDHRFDERQVKALLTALLQLPGQ